MHLYLQFATLRTSSFTVDVISFKNSSVAIFKYFLTTGSLLFISIGVMVFTCKSFTEVIVTKGDHPYVLGVRFELHNGRITDINTIVTDEGDWEFNAENYLNASSKENWSMLPDNQRVDRQTLINAANAYFDMFTYENTKVPWGIPCASLEGGKYSGDGPRTSCKVGIPLEGIEITNRSFVVDVAMGTVNVFCRFGVTQSTRYGKTNGLPDSHTFRLINGKLRYIHSLSVVD
jgi:hypothetical protein